MTMQPKSDPAPPTLDHVPFPLATVEGENHIVRYTNPAFCKLIDKASDEIVGKPFSELLPADVECMALLDRVYRTGAAVIHKGQQPVGSLPVVPIFTMWPVLAEQRPVGVMIQVIQAQSLYDKTLAMNEALLLGSLRQHELAAAADEANARLQAEMVQRVQSERDALMLTKEISHRIKNNLQSILALIGSELTRTPAEFAQGYFAMQARISAIAQLYDLISQSNHGDTVQLDAYLRQLAAFMSASLLETSSGISIEVETTAAEIGPDRAVAFGLLVNELGTNAIKHAFPDGSGQITLSIERIGDQIELIVADDGVGMIAKDTLAVQGRHGSDYVAIFVRQLGGTMTVAKARKAGTTINIRFPLHPAS